MRNSDTRHLNTPVCGGCAFTDEKIMLRSIYVCSDENLRQKKNAQMKMLRWKKVLRYKCSDPCGHRWQKKAKTGHQESCLLFEHFLEKEITYRKDTYNLTKKSLKSGCRHVLTVQRNGTVEKVLRKKSILCCLKCPGEEALSKIKCRQIISVLTVISFFSLGPLY